ncbi:hypothetical protein SISSUDRAFT_288640 [Sistotremastrum suecicum HHB10207 ss-3]|uniref:Uncharacterized protein n=1 Tax=Sistotremastrum suecicum HHB10207 ss-3 TaxID=1314776 RepID=A0A165ZK05_9AGAM|nr:hypothetical protein SISSUDRAFT_288640 [Sistotremastrum suecicum HHB10207 ss-3]
MRYGQNSGDTAYPSPWKEGTVLATMLRSKSGYRRLSEAHFQIFIVSEFSSITACKTSGCSCEVERKSDAPVACGMNYESTCRRNGHSACQRGLKGLRTLVAHRNPQARELCSVNGLMDSGVAVVGCCHRARCLAQTRTIVPAEGKWHDLEAMTMNRRRTRLS